MLPTSDARGLATHLTDIRGQKFDCVAFFYQLTGSYNKVHNPAHLHDVVLGNVFIRRLGVLFFYTTVESSNTVIRFYSLSYQDAGETLDCSFDSVSSFNRM